MNTATDIILKNVEILSRHTIDEEQYLPRKEYHLPAIDSLREIVELIKEIIFPGFFGKNQINEWTRPYNIGVNIEKLHSLLSQQINYVLHFFTDQTNEVTSLSESELSLTFIDRIPEIKRILYTDIKAMFTGDPAAKSYSEVIFCYPAIQAMIHYRVAHELLLMGIPIIPRIITELAHSATGIDIHPGAQIGEYFSIDHGTGVVIGETCIIGNHVSLYQGVTLGARSFTLDERGNPMNVPRHPIIEDRVVIYSNSTILGRITIGHDSTIGGNIWQTSNVPPHSRILQRKAISTSFTDGLGI